MKKYISILLCALAGSAAAAFGQGYTPVYVGNNFGHAGQVLTDSIYHPWWGFPALDITPDTTSFNEGIRMHASTNGVSDIFFGAVSGQSGTGVGQFGWLTNVNSSPHTLLLFYNNGPVATFDEAGGLALTGTLTLSGTSAAPSNTTTPVGWVTFKAGATVYKLPAYQ